MTNRWIECSSSMPNRIQLNLAKEGSDKVLVSVVATKSRCHGRGGSVDGSLFVRPDGPITEAVTRVELEEQIKEAGLPVPEGLRKTFKRVAATWGTRRYFSTEQSSAY